MSEYVVITERFSRKEWWRKIGEGPWLKVDLDPYNGIVPVAFMSNDPDICLERETLADPRTLQSD